MAVLDILHYPDPRLKQTSVPVESFDEALRMFVADLEETMRAGPGGVGIAAPQVGRFERIVIIDVSSKPKIKQHGRLVLINPEILAWEGMVKGREGCMSVPDFTGNVIRAESVRLSAQDEQGDSREFEMDGFEARAVQHEIDHLDGILFIDRISVLKRSIYKKKLAKALKNQ